MLKHFLIIYLKKKDGILDINEFGFALENFCGKNYNEKKLPHYLKTLNILYFQKKPKKINLNDFENFFKTYLKDKTYSENYLLK